MNPTTPMQGCAARRPRPATTRTDAMSGETIRRAMRRNGKTIRSLAAAMNITQTRVRHVRRHGVAGTAFVLDWIEALAA